MRLSRRLRIKDRNPRLPTRRRCACRRFQDGFRAGDVIHLASGCAASPLRGGISG